MGNPPYSVRITTISVFVPHAPRGGGLPTLSGPKWAHLPVGSRRWAAGYWDKYAVATRAWPCAAVLPAAAATA